MPELPEVETIARGLNKRVAGDVIESVWIGSKPQPLKSSAKEIVKVLEGARINKVKRVGKLYADESLFRAGIRPRRRANTVTRDQLRKLYKAMREVLEEAIKAGGSSVSDYVDAGGEEGFFQLQLRVYMRTGEPCFTCKTPIKRVVTAGRSSHYCPRCQK